MRLLEGKNCIVTGGAGSLGQATARLFLAEGARVMLVDLREADLRRAAEALAAADGALAWAAADVTQAAMVEGVVASTVARFGRIDVLFSNAGIFGTVAPIAEYPEDVFDAVYAVHVKGAFLACKYAVPQMNDGGSIIITSSIMGVTADPGVCAYATSKHALIGLARTVAKEAAPRRIRVNILGPGPIDNTFQTRIEERLTEVVGEDGTEMLNRAIPLGRHGRAEEVARMVLFLASDQSSFSTGSIFMADGGMNI